MVNVIKIGVKVLSKDETTGEIAYKEVMATLNYEADQIYKIHLSGQMIESTDSHLFWGDRTRDGRLLKISRLRLAYSE